MAGFNEELMSADAIAHMTGGFEPQRTNNGMLVIVGLGNGGAGGAGGAGGSGSDDLLRLSIDTFPLPKQQNGSIELDYLNEKRKVAGKVTIDDMDIVYKDWVDKETAKILWEWRVSVYDPLTGKVGLARDYKKKGLITIFAPNGTLQREWEVYGMWPMNMDPGDYDMAGEENVKITMSIAVDKAVFITPAATAAA